MKPSIPKGTRDFSPVEMTRRNYMFDTIKAVFREHGFLPLETPAMENLSTLMGKYGDEGDKLLFKILNSGNFLGSLSDENALMFSHLTSAVTRKKAMLHNISAPKEEAYQQAGAIYDEKNEITSNLSSIISPTICEKGLRYDLTVPFARYVVQHQGEITFPFRRYQVQPVWRADRPQKGRYREFYQCDVDIIGSRSLLNEVELVQIVEKVFGKLGIGVTLKLNNRKILAGIAESIGYADKMMDITIAIDKLEKIGMDAVKAELSDKGISDEAFGKLRPILELNGSNREKLEKLRRAIETSETGMRGIAEMETIFNYTDALGTNLDIELDLSLARGLNYYTGAIFEVKANDFAIGSICGGGRYDDLTGIFGMPDTSGVGISFGADRIYDVMLGLDLFPAEATVSTRAIFLNFGDAEELAALKALAALRSSGIPSEIYPEAAKMKKQMDYANKRGIPYVVIIGSEELAAGNALIKNMLTGEQAAVSLRNIAQGIK